MSISNTPLLFSVLILALLVITPVTATNVSGSLSITSIPEGGVVIINGTNYGNTPVMNIIVPSGTHIIEVRKDGYTTYNTTVNMTDGKHMDIIANLQHHPDRGIATILSEPSGGDLYIDGNIRGVTDITVDNLLPGRHEILIKKEGYEDYHDVISASTEIITEYTEYLVPLPGTGFLSVTSFPDGAAVQIDGKSAGTTPTLLRRITSGNHSVVICKDGYWNFTGVVNVKGGESLQVTADLARVPTTSTLYLDSSPSGAGIYLDGTFKGSAPQTMNALPAGNYLLEFRFLGNTSLNQSFTFTPGSTHEILASLDSANEGSIIDREWEYENSSRLTKQPGWIQVNATPVIEQTFNWTSNGHEAQITLDIPQDLYEYYQMQPHPTNMTGSTLAGYAISDRDREYLHILIKRLKDVSGFESYSARNDYHNVVSFVQGITYSSDINLKTGQTNEYWKYPLETLADKGGDCEDTAILAAALLREMGYDTAVVFLPGENEGHAAIAVACDNCNGYYYPINGKKYYYLETAGDEWFSPGTMEKKYQSVVATVIPLGTEG
ncbi:PEGA domain-containing protein [Methanoregula sp.]|uniref:PEGA domain-containing protein n=1 Tax=Methanoregula sp. TaxID=2052170 RepID=UPI00236EF9EE|nr:PEGA domain-containing protein [Methanoregula sp.]MDD1687320.1 PEGA domain-containing protein [Methanoregula sp.]